jgi:hypothetical protein
LVIEDGKVIGRIYEQRYVAEDVRWLCSITAFHVNPAFEITTNDRVPTLEQAKAAFREAWSKVRAASEQKEQQRT